MELSFLYELLNKENIGVFIAGWLAGFGSAKLLFERGDKKRGKEYEKIAGHCIWSYKLKKQSVGLYRFFKKGKKCGVDCMYLSWQKRGLVKKPHCTLLDAACKEFD